MIWRRDKAGEKDFRIIHQGRCDDRGFGYSMDLETHLGVDGLTYLLTFLSYGPVKLLGDLSGTSRSVASLDEFVDFVRRVQVPGYEEARRHYADERVLEALSDANEWFPYVQSTMIRINNEEL